MTGSIPSPWAAMAPPSAVPRILDTYRKFGLKQSFFIPAWCIEQYPEAVEAILKDGHEIGHHGLIHEDPIETKGEAQQIAFEKALDIHKRRIGTRAARLPRARLQRDPAGDRPADRAQVPL